LKKFRIVVFKKGKLKATERWRINGQKVDEVNLIV
jgi:hypothetical protein